MNYNDATDKDLPADPDATENVPVDLEQLLHKQLDEARNAKTVGAMRAARPLLRPSQRISTAKISHSRIPPMPIHTLPPPAPDEDDDATCVYDRASVQKVSLGRVSTPSMKGVAFPAPTFTAPRKPQPFSTIPAMPAAKRAADASQGITPVQPVLPPTSRRELVVMPKANESVPPVSFPSPSQFPSYPPVADHARGSALAAVLTLAFALASMLVIGVAVFRPAMLERGKVALASAMRPHEALPGAPAKANGNAAAAQPPTTIAVPPILIDDEPDVTIGDDQTYAIFPESAKGHRVFIDGRAIGDADVPALVDCGKHKLQIGSTGKERQVDLPCGGGYRISE